MPEEIQSDVPVVDETTVQEKKPMSFEDGVIKVDLSELNKPVEDAIPEQEADASDVPIVQPEDTPSSEEVVEEVPQEQELVHVEAESIIEEITEEEVAETAEDLEEEVEEAIEEQIQSGTPLPENLQKVVDFMEETNGTLEDYVRLNQDYSSLNDKQLLREYYEATKPHLEKEDIDFLMEDNFEYDEDIDDDRDIRRKKLAHREELAKAKSHLEGLKGKYYEEIKGGSKLNPEQKEKLVVLHKKLKDRHAKAFIQSLQIEESSEQALSKMKEQLHLTEEQVRIAQPIIEESIKERRTIIQKYKEKDRPDFYSLRREIRELQESVEKRLSQMLTVEQMQKYLGIQKRERRKVHSEKRRRSSIF